MISTPLDVNANVKGVLISTGSATAGGTGDATKVTGATIDRDNYFSASIQVAYTCTLASGKTLSFAVEVQESTDGGSTWGTAQTIQASTVAATNPTTGGVLQIGDRLNGRARYVRYNITPDLSNTTTDVMAFGAVAVLGGAHAVPAV